MDDIYRNPGPLQFEGPGADSKAVSLCVEDLDYMGRIKELNDYLDKVLHCSLFLYFVWSTRLWVETGYLFLLFLINISLVITLFNISCSQVNELKMRPLVSMFHVLTFDLLGRYGLI